MTEIDIYLRKVLLGEANEQEQRHVQQWLDRAPLNERTFQEIKRSWTEPDQKPRVIHEEEIVNRIWERGHGSGNSRIVHFIQTHSATIFRSAAALILVLGAIFAVHHILVDLEPPGKERISVTSYVLKENPAGQKSRLYLSDGSVVTLNAGSSLEYSKPFSDTIRHLRLSGEAYFEVAKDTAKPFVVDVDGLRVTALGTAFNISAYDGDPSRCIALKEGMVSVAQAGKERILTPGQVAATGADFDEIRVYEADVNSLSAWTQGILVLDNLRFREMMLKLERWYGVEIEIYGKIKTDKLFKGGRFAKEPLEVVLMNLQYGRSFRFDIDGDTVRIYFN